MLLVSCFIPVYIKAEEVLSAADIAVMSESVYPGKDQKSRLTFIIREANNTQRKVILHRFWKRYNKKGNIMSKVIVFHEYPPESMGSSFMSWSYNLKANKQDDQWLYIPLLKVPQKLPEPVQELFGESSLKPADMAPRDVELDNHKLIKEETIGNTDYYVIESIPKKKNVNYDYGKLIKWIKKDNFLKEKVEYYDYDGKPLKEQFITWKNVGKAWVWEKVVIRNLQTSVEIILSVNDIEVDTGLSDKIFTTDNMVSKLLK